MHKLLLALATTGLVIAALWAIAAVLVMRRVHRRNRVSPGVRSNAPLTWLWSPRTAPRLHRRLRACVVSAHASTTSTGRRPCAPITELADDLEQCAVRLDHDLVAADRVPRAVRGQPLAELRRSVAQVEQLAVRIERLGGSWADDGSPAGVAALGHRVDAVETALRDLVQL